MNGRTKINEGVLWRNLRSRLTPFDKDLEQRTLFYARDVCTVLYLSGTRGDKGPLWSTGHTLVLPSESLDG